MMNLSNQLIHINLSQFHLVGTMILALAQLGIALLNQLQVHGMTVHQALLIHGLVVLIAHLARLVLTLAGMTNEIITINHRISFIR